MRTSQDRPGAMGRDAGSRAHRGHKFGVALGALAAALASAGLAYWISSGGDPTLSTPPPGAAVAPSQPIAYAPPAPDAGQVSRAYEQLQETYADQGARGVVAFAQSCAQALRSDPGVLDFCLAFDMFAGALDFDDPADAAWRSATAVRDLDLARSVLPPGADPAARIAQVRALARRASLEAPDADVAQAAPPATVPAAKAESAAAAASAKARQTADACGSRPTAVQRAVCASPALREAEQRMRVAYRRAVAAGANPRRLARGQADFRSDLDDAAPDREEMARLYHQRTQALEAQARRPKPAKAKRSHPPAAKPAPAETPAQIEDAPYVGDTLANDAGLNNSAIDVPPFSLPAEN